MRVFAADSALPTFDREQLTRVGDQARQYQAEGRKVVLVLGDVPPEAYAPQPNHFKFDATNGFETEPYIVYMGLWEEDCVAQNFIHGDFNQLELLSCMNSAFGSVFDLITVDWSVRKFMNCTEEQFRSFIGMLKGGGSMVFDNDSGMRGCCLQADYHNRIGGNPLFKCQGDETAYSKLSEEEKNRQEKKLASIIKIKRGGKERLPHDYTLWAQRPIYRNNYEELQSLLINTLSSSTLGTYPSYVQYNDFPPPGASQAMYDNWQQTSPLTEEMNTLCEDSYAAHITEWGTRLADVATIETLFCKPLYLSDTRYDTWDKKLEKEHIIRITKK